MSERDGYGFCPRCGALMQDGVCRSCGYIAGNGWQAGMNGQENYGGQAGTNGRPPYGTPVPNRQEPVWSNKNKKPGRGKVLAIVCAMIGVLCIGGIIIFMVLSIQKVIDEVDRESFPGYGYGSDDGYFGYGNPYEDDGYGDYDDSYEDYIPSEKDDYYKEITDAVVSDLDYQIVWGSLSLRPDDDENACTYECIYPVLTGEDGDEKYGPMNRILEDVVCKYKTGYQEYDSGISSYGYVTYMDEEKISVVVKHSFYEKKTTTPRVEAVTLRIDTGEIISHEEMVQVDEELAWQFRSRNAHQNGTVEFVDELSDEELMEYLKNGEDSVMFYTPGGLEIGFNYDGGWGTVTLKTNTL